jgi:putative PIN family toxin of toxin-antitoxin system
MSALRNIVVLDSNLVVSAFLNPRGAAAAALCIAIENFEVVCSKETFAELAEVLQRDKFDRYASKQERLARLQAYAQSVLFYNVPLNVTDCKDPKDNKFLALAVTTHAKALVSGDKKDLVSMNPYLGIPIIGVREFIETYPQVQRAGLQE